MKSIRLVILDLDGTLYIDHQVIDGAVEAVIDYVNKAMPYDF